MDGAAVKDVASEHRVKINSINHILRQARRKPKVLEEKAIKYYDGKADDAKLEEHIVANIDSGITINNAAQIQKEFETMTGRSVQLP